MRCASIGGSDEAQRSNDCMRTHQRFVLESGLQSARACAIIVACVSQRSRNSFWHGPGVRKTLKSWRGVAEGRHALVWNAFVSVRRLLLVGWVCSSSVTTVCCCVSVDLCAVSRPRMLLRESTSAGGAVARLIVRLKLKKRLYILRKA